MRVSVSRFEGGPMCDECVELDKKIERYRKVSSFTFDPLAIAALKKQISDLEAQKAALHADEGNKSASV
jgi:hypothetical protein